MKFLIAGFGSIGRRHFRNLLALGEKDILFYRTRRSTLPEDELQGFLVETDLEKALAHHPDAVIVANPTAYHLPVAIPAAQSGCALFLEKPISHSLEGIDHLRAALAANGQQALVGFQFRFHPGIQRMRRLLADGAIGQPYGAQVHYGEYLPGWHPWEDYRQSYSARADMGGGVILTQCHMLDYLRWMLGDVESVWCFAEKLSALEVDVEDTAEIGLRFRNGALASLHLDITQQPAEHRLEICGTQGTIRWDNADGTVHLFRTAKAEWEAFPPPTGFERNAMFLEEMRHFIAILQRSEQPLCSLEDGIESLRLTLAAKESAQLGTLARL